MRVWKKLCSVDLEEVDSLTLRWGSHDIRSWFKCWWGRLQEWIVPSKNNMFFVVFFEHVKSSNSYLIWSVNATWNKMLLFSDSWMDTWTQPRGGEKNLTNLKADLDGSFAWRPHWCWLYIVEDSRSRSAAVPLNFHPLRSNLSINLLNMHDSVPVPPVTRSTEREVLQLYVKSSELYD